MWKLRPRKVRRRALLSEEQPLWPLVLMGRGLRAGHGWVYKWGGWGRRDSSQGGVGREAAGARGLAGVSPVGPDGACSPPGRPPEPHGEVERQALAEPHAGDVHMRWEDTRVWPEEPVGCQDAWGVRRIQRGFGNSGNKSGLSWAKWNNHSPGLHI